MKQHLLAIAKRLEHLRRRKKNIKLRTGGISDSALVAVVLGLSAFGLLMVYDSSVAIAIRDFADPYFFAKEQLKWLIIGFVFMSIFSRIDYHVWGELALPFIIVTIVLLILVFLPGLGVRALGAHRWLNFGVFILQPAELAKLVMIIYLSAWLSAKKHVRLVSFFLVVGLVTGLIVLEPDLGTSIILVGISVVVYFLSGAPLTHFLTMIPMVVVGVVLLIFIAPYRLERLMTFLDPDRDPLGSSYQIKQVIVSLGSGGIFGVGIGKSMQKYEYLPEANTDSIFAIIGEEVGLLGSLMVFCAFIFIIWRGFAIASRAPDRFGRLLGLGISMWLSIQATINLSAMVALVPITGVPLPLISYGGSSLIITLSAIGMLLNISRQAKKSV